MNRRCVIERAASRVGTCFYLVGVDADATAAAIARQGTAAGGHSVCSDRRRASLLPALTVRWRDSGEESIEETLCIVYEHSGLNVHRHVYTVLPTQHPEDAR